MIVKGVKVAIKDLEQCGEDLLSGRGPKEQSQEESLGQRRGYRERDPGFRKAIAEFAEAEGVFEDPLKGAVVEGDSIEEICDLHG